jgi:hypothetical protein
MGIAASGAGLLWKKQIKFKLLLHSYPHKVVV